MQIEELSVVIVDKHPLMRMAISTAVASVEKMNVIAEYASTRELLDIGEKILPQLILLGIGNPDEDELIKIRVLRHFFPTAQIVVLVSGELEGQSEIARYYGAHAVVEKTISRDALLDKLAENISILL